MRLDRPEPEIERRFAALHAIRERDVPDAALDRARRSAANGLPLPLTLTLENTLNEDQRDDHPERQSHPLRDEVPG